LGNITKKDDCLEVPLGQSVANMLRLLTLSKFGECKYDPTFGCAIWEHDFETITNIQGFKETIKASIEAALSAHEKRLTQTFVEVNITQTESILKTRRVKNRIMIVIRGKLLKTNEEFMWKEDFFIGPLSYY